MLIIGVFLNGDLPTLPPDSLLRFGRKQKAERCVNFYILSSRYYYCPCKIINNAFESVKKLFFWGENTILKTRGRPMVDNFISIILILLNCNIPA